MTNRLPTALLFASLSLSALPPARAQNDLESLQRQFAAERDALIAEKEGRVTFADVKALAQRHAKSLATFLEKDARGLDLVNGRLMLTNIQIDVGDQDAAKKTLGQLDTEAAPALELLTGAEMAQMLGMQAERDAWIDLALRKETPFEERMALGMFLMTRLLEVERGNQLFDQALATAKDDEQRARVLWYKASALREREDLEEGAYDEALSALAKALPNTYFGGVANDRLKSRTFQRGDPAIPLSGRDLDGKELSLTDYRGKAVLLHFWASWDRQLPATAKALAGIAARHEGREFALLGVAVDEDRDAVVAAAKASGMGWRHLFDGKGWLTDAALRYSVEQVPYALLLDRDGKVAALRLHLRDEAGIAEVNAAIHAALAK
jgi:peroxiredoxin